MRTCLTLAAFVFISVSAGAQLLVGCDPSSSELIIFDTTGNVRFTSPTTVSGGTVDSI